MYFLNTFYYTYKHTCTRMLKITYFSCVYQAHTHGDDSREWWLWGDVIITFGANNLID